MGNKKAKILLCISLAFIVIYLIVCIVLFSMDYYQLKAKYQNDPVKINNEVGFAFIVLFFTLVPALGNGLSCIRSVYKMLMHRPYGLVKIIYIISSVLAFAAFALTFIFLFEWLGVMRQNTPNTNLVVDVMLLTEWPIFIVSFILNCIPIKSKTAISNID